MTPFVLSCPKYTAFTLPILKEVKLAFKPPSLSFFGSSRHILLQDSFRLRVSMPIYKSIAVNVDDRPGCTHGTFSTRDLIEWPRRFN